VVKQQKKQKKRFQNNLVVKEKGINFATDFRSELQTKLLKNE